MTHSYWQIDQARDALFRNPKNVMQDVKLCILDSGCLATHSELEDAQIKSIGYFYPNSLPRTSGTDFKDEQSLAISPAPRSRRMETHTRD
jgi:hypothetical protein